MNKHFSPNSLAAGLGLPEISGSLLHADWPAPANVRTLITTRQGGVSQGRYASLNLGDHVGDAPAAVAENRRRVQVHVPVPLAYLRQVHGNRAVPAAESLAAPPEADASFDRSGRAACAVMTADCLPVLFCNRAGSAVAAAHAGWRGLAGGVLENTIAAMQTLPADILAWLGPAIGPDAFEVGADVLTAFTQVDPAAEAAFQPIGSSKYLADIYLLATQILRRAGVSQIYGGEHCTVLERDRFFSYRRDGQTGRMISAIWLSPE
ncbi:peptidoglycan editing factor PgeF [Eikenella sp. S3360]|uniref:Purine nucleoside phosphorylase n=1 Tax=Eikenella glucosivorans TaxID=2766967 RepID=A0ABS0NBF1_9NEIS|nr:peptidoglycan editing factor PgeF [Eikenella glucosivorans]MBH5329621.1 peptidoglycan editing factor PgeF [Eikenella glucosivorans]